jgi:hypothetical protein
MTMDGLPAATGPTDAGADPGPSPLATGQPDAGTLDPYARGLAAGSSAPPSSVHDEGFYDSVGAPSRFGLTDAARWFRHFGRAAHPIAPFDVFSLDANGGNVKLAELAGMAVGIYVVVDEDGRCRYVGKIDRDDPTGIQGRFSGHHAAQAHWSAVWLLPLRDDCPPGTVLWLEGEMIGVFRPDDNTQQVPSGRRRQAVAE